MHTVDVYDIEWPHSKRGRQGEGLTQHTHTHARLIQGDEHRVELTRRVVYFRSHSDGGTRTDYAHRST